MEITECNSCEEVKECLLIEEDKYICKRCFKLAYEEALVALENMDFLSKLFPSTDIQE